MDGNAGCRVSKTCSGVIMAKPYSLLRARMSIKAQRLARKKARRLLSKMKLSQVEERRNAELARLAVE